MFPPISPASPSSDLKSCPNTENCSPITKDFYKRKKHLGRVPFSYLKFKYRCLTCKGDHCPFITAYMYHGISQDRTLLYRGSTLSRGSHQQSYNVKLNPNFAFLRSTVRKRNYFSLTCLSVCLSVVRGFIQIISQTWSVGFTFVTCLVDVDSRSVPITLLRV